MTRLATALPMLAVALVAACAGQPTRFYTLVPSAPPPADSTTNSAPYYIDVQDVSVPQQVDVPQFVLRQSDGEVAVVESRQWIAPLPQEIRDSVAQNLARRLGTIDVHTQGRGSRKVPVVRVALDVTRFDSVLGREARLDVTWTVSRPKPDGAQLRCAGAFVQPAGKEYDSVVAAHQAALDALSAQIAGAVTGGATTCP